MDEPWKWRTRKVNVVALRKNLNKWWKVVDEEILSSLSRLLMRTMHLHMFTSLGFTYNRRYEIRHILPSQVGEFEFNSYTCLQLCFPSVDDGNLWIAPTIKRWANWSRKTRSAGGQWKGGEEQVQWHFFQLAILCHKEWDQFKVEYKFSPRLSQRMHTLCWCRRRRKRDRQKFHLEVAGDSNNKQSNKCHFSTSPSRVLVMLTKTINWHN